MYPLSRTDSRDTDSIQQRQKGELEYLVFPKLEETGVVEHLFTTRTGGVSNGIYSTMNLSFSRGDDLECVRENYRRIGEVLGTDPEHMVASKQTHTTNIHLVTKADAGNGITRPSVYDDIDGLATDIPGIALVTFLCRLCSSVFRGSGTQGHRTGAFRLERNGSGNGSLYGTIYAGTF